jgi:DNA-binding MarR family transcriptional regulator
MIDLEVCAGQGIVRRLLHDRFAEVGGVGDVLELSSIPGTLTVMTDGQQWLDYDEQRAWRGFLAMTALLPGALDQQLQRDAEMGHSSYIVLAMLSEAPDRSLRMSELAARANSSPSRLSHAVTRLEQRGWVRRARSAEDGRGSIARLTDDGWDIVEATAPGHVAAVRRYVFDALSREQVRQLEDIAGAVLAKLDPDGSLRPPVPEPTG